MELVRLSSDTKPNKDEESSPIDRPDIASLTSDQNTRDDENIRQAPIYRLAIHRQNCFFSLSVGIVLLCVSIYLLGGTYLSPNFLKGSTGLEGYDSQSGEVGKDVKSAEDQKKQEETMKGKTSWGLENYKQWMKDHKNKKNKHGRNWTRGDFFRHFNSTFGNFTHAHGNIPKSSFPNPTSFDADKNDAGKNEKNKRKKNNREKRDKKKKKKNTEDTSVKKKEYDFEVLETLDHDPTSFTQGLTYANGELYESTGLYGVSKVRRLNLTDGSVIQSIDMDPKYFGEGLAYYGDNNLIQITWKKKTGFLYKASTLELVKTFQYETTLGEGWGITHDYDNRRFIVSDGSAYLHFWNDETLEETHKVQVTNKNGKPINHLNELEYTPQGVLSNVWYKDKILLIDPETGTSVEYDFTSFWPRSERTRTADCFNGISVSDKEGEFMVTGKKWPKLYRIKLRGFDDLDSDT